MLAPMNSSDFGDLRSLARELAELGGQEALAYFKRSDLEVERKADESPVTQADKAAEAAMRALIERRCPDDAWIGEETGTKEGGSGRCWICDPIDGTKNFINGIPLWATLVACEENGHVVASAVTIPALGDVYDAALGAGAACNGESIHVRDRSNLDECLLCFESYDWFAKNGLADVYMYMMEHTGLQRGMCDAYAHMLIASGCADIMIEPALSVWDIAAPSLIVTEAGGKSTDLHGASSIRSNNALSSNGKVHQAVLDIIQDKRVAV